MTFPLLSPPSWMIGKLAVVEEMALQSPPPTTPWLEVPDSLPLLKQFQQSASKLQWSRVQGADLFLPVSAHYLIIVHLLMSRSSKLVHDSDDDFTAQISSSKRYEQSP
ncbi:hypothetical protein AAES_76641 [Amazona aestiva]|uniref:Uncharacterized protein n=1 Tax=Amazona aestiva TaxID=12930 RepID=A0A0Q3TNR7_AMAAE|nr:hypothetical protein AAES_76641 [Amazona aestiva]